MPEIVDDKSQHCIPFLLERLRVHTERHSGTGSTRPFFLGLNGVQGAGKTVLVSCLTGTGSSTDNASGTLQSSSALPSNTQALALLTTHPGLDAPARPPVRAVLALCCNIVARRYLSYQRRPSCSRPGASEQPASPAPRPALDPRSRSR